LSKIAPLRHKINRNFNIAALNDDRWAEVKILSLKEKNPNAAYDYFWTAYTVNIVLTIASQKKLINLRIGSPQIMN